MTEPQGGGVEITFDGTKRPEWQSLTIADMIVTSELQKTDIRDTFSVTVFPNVDVRNSQITVQMPGQDAVVLNLGSYDENGVGEFRNHQTPEGHTYRTQLSRTEVLFSPENPDAVLEVVHLTIKWILASEAEIPAKLYQTLADNLRRDVEQLEQSMTEINNLMRLTPPEEPVRGVAAAAGAAAEAAEAGESAARMDEGSDSDNPGPFAAALRSIWPAAQADTQASGRVVRPVSPPVETKTTREELEGPPLGFSDQGAVWRLDGKFSSPRTEKDFELWQTHFRDADPEESKLTSHEKLARWTAKITDGHFPLIDLSRSTSQGVAVCALLSARGAVLGSKRLVWDYLDHEKLWIVTGHDSDNGWLHEPVFMLVIQNGELAPEKYIAQNGGPAQLLRMI
jgi:hypothetical protein